MKEYRYALARQGVFLTVQGEGVLCGVPMVFLRLAGCSVGCPECDTDYRVHKRMTVTEIVQQIEELGKGLAEWVWVTGGEPADQGLSPLFDGIRSSGLKIALATSGTKKVKRGFVWGGVDFLSVSIHSTHNWIQRSGDQLNVVPGLNGLRLESVENELLESAKGFTVCYVTPLADREGRMSNLSQCVDWVTRHKGWRLGIQGHKLWGLP